VTALKVTELGDYLKEQRQHAQLSLRQLAAQAGVSNPYLSQVERGLRKPSAEVLQQIAKGLRISAEALYVRAGILEERGDRIEVEAAILTDPFLSERQRRVLLDIYETFRSENERDPAAEEGAESATSHAAPDESFAEGPVSESPAMKRPVNTSPAGKKSTSNTSTVKKTPAKKAPAKKSPAKKSPAQKASAKKASTSKATTKTTSSAKSAQDTEGEN
jgi:transcriptional regulator with XRE-family HTH domain